MINSRDISLLRPDVRANVENLIAECKKQGLKILITNTVRDNEYQAYLYAQGRTRPGGIVTNSKTTTFHGAGLAIDFCQNIKGREYEADFMLNVATIAKAMGFTWGGDWKSIVDKPHLQWDNHGKATYKNAPTMPLYRFNDKMEDNDMTYFKTLTDVPNAYKTAIQKAMTKGALKGKTDGAIDVSEDLCRTLTILDRLGVLDK